MDFNELSQAEDWSPKLKNQIEAKCAFVMSPSSPRNIEKCYSVPSRMYLSLDSTNQKVADFPLSSLAAGILSVLNTNTSTYMTVSELFLGLTENIRTKNTNLSSPQLGRITAAGDVGGEFVFLNKQSKVDTKYTRNYHMLGIGVDNYYGLENLLTPRNDVNYLAETLSKKYGFSVVTLINAEATKRNIERALVSYIPENSNGLSKDDCLLIYLSGHFVDLDGSSKNNYFVPHNGVSNPANNGISLDAFKDYFKKFSVGQILLISDFRFGLYDDLGASFDEKYRNGNADATLKASFAGFVSRIRKDHDLAHKLYEEAYNTGELSAASIRHYAEFMWTSVHNYELADTLFQKACEKADPKHAFIFYRYALFMWEGRKDYDSTEELLQKACNSEYCTTDMIQRLAIFMWTIKEDLDRADELYQQSIDNEPERAALIGNYAQFLFCTQQRAKAIETLKRAKELVHEGEMSLRLELAFYQFCHLPPYSLQPLKDLIDLNIRCYGWLLEKNVHIGVKEGHSHPEFLISVAKVISERENVNSLDSFSIWKKAS